MIPTFNQLKIWCMDLNWTIPTLAIGCVTCKLAKKVDFTFAFLAETAKFKSKINFSAIHRVIS